MATDASRGSDGLAGVSVNGKKNNGKGNGEGDGKGDDKGDGKGNVS